MFNLIQLLDILKLVNYLYFSCIEWNPQALINDLIILFRHIHLGDVITKLLLQS